VFSHRVQETPVARGDKLRGKVEVLAKLLPYQAGHHGKAYDRPVWTLRRVQAKVTCGSVACKAQSERVKKTGGLGLEPQFERVSR
jgi:hypothetical protein